MYAKQIIFRILAYVHINLMENVKLIHNILIKHVADNLKIPCDDEMQNTAITSIPKKHIFGLLFYQ